MDPTQDEDTQETEDFAYSLASAAVPAALVPKQIESASADDPTLKLVRQTVRTGDWSQISGTIYKAMKDELWVVGQVVTREDFYCDAPEPLETNHYVGSRRPSGHGPY